MTRNKQGTKGKRVDPLHILFRSSEFIKGYHSGRDDYASVANTLVIKLQTLIEQTRSSFQIIGKKRVKARKAQVIKELVGLYGIQSGSTLLKKEFQFKTRQEAEEKIKELCGSKILRHTFKIVEI